MAEVRTRTRDQRYTISGTAVSHIGSPTVTQTAKPGETQTTEDTVGNRDGANPFLSVKRTWSVGVLNGTKYSNNTPITTLSGYPLQYNPVPESTSTGPYPFPDLLGMNSAAWEILGSTNPQKAHINVAAAIAELKDAPSLVQGMGRSLLSRVAAGNISLRFAILPMLSDLEKLEKITRAIDDRMRELQHLKEKKVTRRRAELGSGVSQVTHAGNFALNSNRAVLYANKVTIHTYRRWGTAQWKLNRDAVLPDAPDELRNFARRLTLGLNSYGALEAAWELTPFSWLVDYFSDVGNMINATNNAVGLTYSSICLMQHTTSKTYYVPRPDLSSDWNWVRLSGDHNQREERKERRVVFPAVPYPLPYLPNLSAGQMSILGSLAALKLRR